MWSSRVLLEPLSCCLWSEQICAIKTILLCEALIWSKSVFRGCCCKMFPNSIHAGAGGFLLFKVQIHLFSFLFAQWQITQSWIWLIFFKQTDTLKMSLSNCYNDPISAWHFWSPCWLQTKLAPLLSCNLLMFSLFKLMPSSRVFPPQIQTKEHYSAVEFSARSHIINPF